MGKENIDYTWKYMFEVSISDLALQSVLWRHVRVKSSWDDAARQLHLEAPIAPLLDPLLILYTYLLAPYTSLTLGSIKGIENVILKTW